MKEYGTEKLTPQDAQQAILSPITKALQTHNITLDRLASKLNTLMDCTRPAGIDSDGKAITAPDNPTQLKSVVESGKLLQAYPAERKEVTISPVEQLTDTELDERIKQLTKKPVEGKTEGEA